MALNVYYGTVLIWIEAIKLLRTRRGLIQAIQALKLINLPLEDIPPNSELSITYFTILKYPTTITTRY